VHTFGIRIELKSIEENEKVAELRRLLGIFRTGICIGIAIHETVGLSAAQSLSSLCHHAEIF
jgi:hypothetical protein